MNTPRLVTLVALSSLSGTFVAHAQTASAPVRPVNRFGLSYRMGFNLSARFENFGAFAAQTDPGAPIAGIDHTYDNGFNRVDSFGNAPLPGDPETLTTYWGYQYGPNNATADHPSQITAGNQAVVMNSSSSPGGVNSGDISKNPQHGLELNYTRLLGQVKKAFWGFEAAVGYMDLTYRDNRTLSGSVTRISDSYNLGGAVPPLAPYSGSSTGPGVLLGDTPTRTTATIPNGSSISGFRDLGADLLSFRVGPYLEFDLGRRFRASLGGGLAMLSVRSDFSYQETVTLPTLGSVSRSGSGSNNDFLWGGYIAGNIAYQLSRKFDVAAGVQYQTAQSYTHILDDKRAKIDFGNAVFATIGAGYSF